MIFCIYEHGQTLKIEDGGVPGIPGGVPGIPGGGPKNLEKISFLYYFIYHWDPNQWDKNQIDLNQIDLNRGGDPARDPSDPPIFDFQGLTMFIYTENHAEFDFLNDYIKLYG